MLLLFKAVRVGDVAEVCVCACVLCFFCVYFGGGGETGVLVDVGLQFR